MKKRKFPKVNLNEIESLCIQTWRKLAKLSGPNDRLQTREFRSICERLSQFKDILPQAPHEDDYFQDNKTLGAYLLYNWQLHFQEALSLLSELPKPPSRVLDFASGPAPYALAALEHGAQEVVAADKSLNALNLAAQLAGQLGHALETQKIQDLSSPLPQGPFDLITLSHSLQELCSNNEEALKLIEFLLKQLTPDGFLLLVSSSWPQDNKNLLSLRNQLCAKGFTIQAPCIWQGACPALKNNSVCFAQRELEKTHLLSEIHRSLKINLSSLKMSYLLIKAPRAKAPLLDKQDSQERFYRIISPPYEGFHGSRYHLCGEEGKKDLGSRLQEHPKQSKSYEYLRRGDLVAIKDPLEQNEHLDITPNTSCRLAAPAGRPLPELFPDESI